METINELIKQSVNPFDNLAARNFWEESEPSPIVEFIHQDALINIKSALSQVSQDRQTRTILLHGDRGVGKTHFLGRLKKTLNEKAFFVYIEPFPSSDHIWRHILRYTVDSLVNAPAGQKESQLILWLKGCLSTVEKGLQSEQQGLINRITNLFGKLKEQGGGERKAFIDILKQSIGTKGIYNANEFFGILYDLTNPVLYSLCCEWLKGDNLDEESLKKLQVKQLIDEENKARGILGNFSKISAKTKPIVLCFDNLESLPKLPDGSIDLQFLFDFTTIIYNGQWQGFLIIISSVKSFWNHNSKRVQDADLERISLQIPLDPIPLEQAEALWISRLHPLHRQASPKPDSPVYPLSWQLLEKSFPGGAAVPRAVLMLGKQEFQNYKQSLFEGEQHLERGDKTGKNTLDLLSELKLIWLNEFQKVQQKATHLRHYSSPELIGMLQEALSALQVEGIKPKFLASSKYASHSLCYHPSNQTGRVGLVWAEESHMNSFCSVMEACHKSAKENHCQTLYLIRSESVGKPNNKGYKLYAEIFTSSPHRHIKPDLSSVHYLATYHKLVNDARAGELVIGNKTPNLKELEFLIGKSKILNDCLLLKTLRGIENTSKDTGQKVELQPVENFMLNLIQTQFLLARHILIKNATSHFPNVNESQVQKIIQGFCQDKLIQIVDEQLICWIPKSS